MKTDHPTATLTALYVEDNAADADLARRVLQQASPPIVLTVVPSVHLALERLGAGEHFDWVLFDLSLPDGDGLDVLRHMRQHRMTSVTVAITGTGDERAAVSALKLGVDDYIVKSGHYLAGLHQQLMQARQRVRCYPKSQQIRVVYVEDNAHDSELTLQHLGTHAPHVHMHILSAPFTDLHQRLSNTPHDVLLMDVRLDTLDAFDVIKRLAQGERCDRPIVLITGQGSEDIAVQALRMGVHDYILKEPGYLQRLPGILESAYVTAQLLKERQQLRRSENQLQQLTRHVPGAIVLLRLTPEGHMTPVYATEALQRIQGLSLDDLTSGTLEERVYTDDQSRLKSCITKAAQSGEVCACEYRLRLEAQGWRWFETQMSPEPQPDGTTLLFCYTFDVTERRQIQELSLSTQTAIRANQAKTDFLSRMSHELRTPLNAVLGFAQLLKSDSNPALSDRQLRQVLLIEQAGKHLLQMINEVLNLARIEAGEIALSPTLMDTQAICEEALSLLAPFAEQHKVTLAFHQWPADSSDSRIWAIHADPVRIRQIIVNLLSNGIKYNRPEGHVDITLSRAEDKVIIQVRDTGIGMTSAQQSHLFEPFNRLGADRTTIEGTGIGLVIVRKLVDLMGGQLHVHSIAGEGSTFEVIMPASTADEQGGGFADTGSSSFGAFNTTLPSHKTILYAEDDAINVELVRQIVAMRLQCELKVATSGAQAIEMALADPPDLLLLDMQLGDMDGIAVSDALRADARVRSLPRVALSANALPEQIQRAKEHGFADYLTKPVNVGKFIACMNQHLGLSNGDA